MSSETVCTLNWFECKWFDLENRRINSRLTSRDGWTESIDAESVFWMHWLLLFNTRVMLIRMQTTNKYLRGKEKIVSTIWSMARRRHDNNLLFEIINSNSVSPYMDANHSSSFAVFTISIRFLFRHAHTEICAVSDRTSRCDRNSLFLCAQRAHKYWLKQIQIYLANRLHWNRMKLTSSLMLIQRNLILVYIRALCSHTLTIPICLSILLLFSKHIDGCMSWYILIQTCQGSCGARKTPQQKCAHVPLIV